MSPELDALADALSFDRLARPWALGLLALVLAAAAARFATRARRRATLLHGAAHRLARVAPTLRARLAGLPAVLRVAALAALCLALARPEDVSGREEVKTEGVALQIVVDRSPSMQESIDFDGRTISRLDAVKRVAARFIAGDEPGPIADQVSDQSAARAPNDTPAEDPLPGRAGDLIGITAFGAFADTVAPLTREHRPLLGLLERVSFATGGDRGTAIGEGVSLAVARLVRAEEALAASLDQDPDADPDGDPDEAAPDFTIKSKAVILLTDGQDTTGEIGPLEAAEDAAERGITIYAIGIGSARPRDTFGSFSAFGRGSGIEVDEQTLRDMVSLTGGRYWLADSGSTLREIYEEIDALETTEVTRTEFTDREPKHPAWAALALALVAAEVALSATVLRRAP